MSKYIDVNEIPYSEPGTVTETEIDSIPAADVAPVVHAHWEFIGLRYGAYEHECSRCHRSVCTSSSVKIENINAVYPYCHCGAKMDGKEKI